MRSTRAGSASHNNNFGEGSNHEEHQWTNWKLYALRQDFSIERETKSSTHPRHGSEPRSGFSKPIGTTPKLWMHSMMARQPKISTAVLWRDQAILGLLEALQRERDLKEPESVLMDRTIRRLTPRREIWRWSEKEDRTLKEFIKRRARIGRPKPFQPNDEVRILAADMGRTYMAVHRRIERLRKRMKCSDASGRAKG